MTACVALHDRIVRACASRHTGYEVRGGEAACASLDPGPDPGLTDLSDCCAFALTRLLDHQPFQTSFLPACALLPPISSAGPTAAQAAAAAPSGNHSLTHSPGRWTWTLDLDPGPADPCHYDSNSCAVQIGTEGDAFTLAFWSPHDAVMFACDLQQVGCAAGLSCRCRALMRPLPCTWQALMAEEGWPAELLAQPGCAPVWACSKGQSSHILLVSELPACC
jgi:hypothetical protein